MAQPNQAAANPYAPPVSGPAPGHKQCDSCGADILAKAEICPKCGVRQHSNVNKAVLLLLTFFFGGIGAHRFYLRNWGLGTLYLVFFWTFIPALVALVEFVVFCFTSSERLNEKYSSSGVAAVLVVVGGMFFAVFMIGIIAAVSIPAYQDYTVRARVSGVIVSANPWRTAVTEHWMETKKLPNSAADLPRDLVPREAPDPNGTATLGENGVITLTLSPATGARTAGKTILVRPQVEPGGLSWECTGGTLEAKYRPGSCRAPR
jgi:TM2 domain-containing membrane protein YozV/Tfp pilus assembly major pilin PilA